MTGPTTSAETEVCKIHKFIEGLSGSVNAPDEAVLQDLQDDEKSAEIASKELVNRFTSSLNRQLLKQLRDEHNLRKKFMPYVYWLVVGVLAATFVILIASGWVSACGHTFLSDKVLITLLTGTVIDIIGILYIAVRWLFHQTKATS